MASKFLVYPPFGQGSVTLARPWHENQYENVTLGPITHGPITHGPIDLGPITLGPIQEGDDYDPWRNKPDCSVSTHSVSCRCIQCRTCCHRGRKGCNVDHGPGYTDEHGDRINLRLIIDSLAETSRELENLKNYIILGAMLESKALRNHESHVVQMIYNYL